MNDGGGTLRALVETVLAFDHPDFPAIGVDQVEARVLASFPLDGELRATLRAFSELQRFPRLDGNTRQVEEELLQSEGCPPGEVDRIIAERARTDEERFQAFAAELGGSDRFEGATLEARRAYLRLWARSPLAARRRLYTSLKALVLIPAYGLPALRRAVGAP